MPSKTEILIPNSYYHIYNRANGSELLFLNDNNYLYFLKHYQLYISPIAHTYCYCLMPNHFHFLVRIKSEEEITTFFNQHGADKKHKPLHLLISQQFSNFFNSYAKAFNKTHRRKGSLFMHTYKRKLIDTQEYLLTLIHYIHSNPIEAKLSKSFTNWAYSSYPPLISNETTFLNTSEILSWFGGKANFIQLHQHTLPLNFSVQYD
jgi:putative transposase